MVNIRQVAAHTRRGRKRFSMGLHQDDIHEEVDALPVDSRT
jgi:hypothetical protein